MVNNSEAELDLVFAALSDSTRRHVLAQLDTGSFTVSELASAHDMTLAGFLKHLSVLETAGLIARSKDGRVVRCELDGAPMRQAAQWISRYERFWNGQLDALGRFLNDQEELEKCKPPKPITKRGPTSLSAASTRSHRKKSGTPGPTRKR
jgi:DNA-binding transcriptional ArsR family regulator